MLLRMRARGWHSPKITLGEAVISMNENETREALETVRKDAKDPTLAVGDYVFSRGMYAMVTEIKRHLPGTHDNSPIRNDWTAVQVVTDMGTSRWHGIDPTPQSGYAHCACRDCMETIVAKNMARPELCDECHTAGCGDPDATTWPECQREDAYEG